MAVDYMQRKAAKKERRRNGSRKKNSNSADGAAGGEGGSCKDKKTRPKRGRSGPRRLCQGMCFQVPKLLDDDITWRSNDDDGERGTKVYDPRAPPPPREAERAAAAAARLLESGAAEAKVLLERDSGGGGGGSADPNKRKRNRKRDHGGEEEAAGKANVEAPATPSKRRGASGIVPAAPRPPPPPPPCLSTGAGIDFASAAAASAPGARPSHASHPALDRSFDLSTLPLSLRMLAAAYGLEAPTRVQSSAWAAAMKEEEEEEEEEDEEEDGTARAGKKKKIRSKNLLIVAPPGAGMTLAYLLPAAAKVVVENEGDEDESEEDGSEEDDDDVERRCRRRKCAKRASSSSSANPLPSPRVLVLVPTRELARQVAAAARPLRRAAGLKVVRVAGGDRREDQVYKLRASAAGGGGKSNSESVVVHVLVATPGRLLDLVRGGDVGLGSIRTVVFDEADKMLSSAGIAEQLAEIRGIVLDGRGGRGGGGGGGGGAISQRRSSPPPQFMLVSATMPAPASRLASSWLGEGFASVGNSGGGGDGDGDGDEGEGLARLQASSSSSSTLVTQVVTVCAEQKNPAKLLKHLARDKGAAAAAGERHAPRVLIFANRIKTVKFIADFLWAQERKQLQEKRKMEEKKDKKKKGGSSSSSGSKSSPASASRIDTLHGDRTQPERDAALAAFRAGKVTTLVATDVAARGLDVSGLRHVVNYDFPSTIESYEHRVGRSGRDGRGGHVASFFGRPLAPLARGVVEFLQGHGQGVDPNLVRLAEAYEVAKRR